LVKIVTVVLKNINFTLKTAPSLQKQADFCHGRFEKFRSLAFTDFAAPFADNHEKNSIFCRSDNDIDGGFV